jgi:hypothetical protein
VARSRLAGEGRLGLLGLVGVGRLVPGVGVGMREEGGCWGVAGLEGGCWGVAELVGVRVRLVGGVGVGVGVGVRWGVELRWGVGRLLGVVGWSWVVGGWY